MTNEGNAPTAPKPAARTVTVALPRKFVTDHIDRGCFLGKIVSESARLLTVELDADAYAELHTDAAHYADADGWESDYRGLCRSAAATLRRLDAVEPPTTQATEDATYEVGHRRRARQRAADYARTLRRLRHDYGPLGSEGRDALRRYIRQSISGTATKPTPANLRAEALDLLDQLKRFDAADLRHLPCGAQDAAYDRADNAKRRAVALLRGAVMVERGDL